MVIDDENRGNATVADFDSDLVGTRTIVLALPRWSGSYPA